MISLLKNKLRSLLYYYKRKKFAQFSIIGENILFNKNSIIRSENKKDIVLEKNIMMYGSLISANGGKLTIGKNTSIRTGCKIFCSNKVLIGDNVIFADNVIISDTNHHPVNPNDRLKMIKSGWSSSLWSWKHADSKPIIIKNNVWLGQYSRILKGVVVGENSIVASNSVVTKDVPSNSIVAGNPAHVVKRNIQLTTEIFE